MRRGVMPICNRPSIIWPEWICFISAAVCFIFGHFGHSKSKFNRVIFIGPESQIRVRRDIIANVMPGVTFGGDSAEELRLAGKVLQVDLMYFCKAIMEAASAWAI